MTNSAFLDLVYPWFSLTDSRVVCQYCCLQLPSRPDASSWDICFPDLVMYDNTFVIMHCQDFLNVSADKRCVELEAIEQHFGIYANKVVVVVWNINLESVYTGPLNLVYLPYYSYEIIMNLSQCLPEWQPKMFNDRQYRFLSLNGTSKNHRMRTVEKLKNLKNGIVSSHENPLPVFTYDQHLLVTNEENFLKLINVYNNTDVNIVTESIYRFYPGIITEKSIFAWLSLQVVILVGYPGIVAHVRRLGFDMFDDVVDHSYDSLPNKSRVEAAIDLNRDILTHGIDRQLLLPRLIANQAHVLSWPKRMIKSYRRKIRQIISS